MADEVRDKARGGAVIKRVRIVPLLQRALLHDANQVANRKGFELVVGHKQRRGAGRLQNAAHFVRQAFAQLHVQVGEGLIEQHQLGARRERPCQGYALLLPARKFVGIAPLAARHSNQCQHLGNALGLRPLRHAVQTKGDVAAHAEVREQGVVLKHHANAPLFGRHVVAGAADTGSAQLYLAAFHGGQTGHCAQQRGLAAA